MQYERRTPEDTILYQTIEKYLSEFRAQTQETDRNLPDFVFEEIEAYLKCGLLSHGFARVYCDSCKESSLVAFSCKKRGFCPSCCGRRMAQTAAHQVDHIFPEVPVRQWVLTFPFFLRSYIAYNPDACTDALDVFMDVLRQKYRELCLGGLWIDNYWINGGREVHYDIGSCTSFQRFNGALALFPHYHSLLCDGLFVENGEKVEFIPAPSLTDEDVMDVMLAFQRRLIKRFIRRGYLRPTEDGGLQLYWGEEELTEEEAHLLRCYAASTPS